VIRCTFGLLAARIMGIKSSASSKIIVRAVSLERFHRIHSTGRYGRHWLAPLGIKNNDCVANMIFWTDTRTRQSLKCMFISVPASEAASSGKVRDI
jgi:hypothetical protein